MTEPRSEPMELPDDPDAPKTMRAPVSEDARPVPARRDPETTDDPGDPGDTPPPPGEPMLSA